MNRPVIKLVGEKAILADNPDKTGGGEIKIKIPLLAKKIANEMNPLRVSETPILPLGTRYYLKKGEVEVLAIEQAPAIRTITFDNTQFSDDYKDGKGRIVYGKSGTYQLAFPYVVFIITFLENELQGDYCSVFYLKNRLKTVSDNLCYTNLTNIGREEPLICPICVGNALNYLNHRKPIAKQAQVFIDSFWNSSFNSDITGDYVTSRELDSRILNFETWQKASKKNPKFILKVPWIRAGNLKTAIDEAMIWFQYEELGIDGEAEDEEEQLPQDVSEIADIMYRLKEVE
jgi:hypothetical protein